MTPTDAQTPIRMALVKELASLQGRLLRDYGVGHHGWYAESLVAAAYGGLISETNCPGIDVVTDRWGRVQVKSRVDGTDGRQNRVNLGRYVPGSFDHLIVVIFCSDHRLMGAAALPCDAALSLVRASGHVAWHAASAHRRSITVTHDLRLAGGEIS